MGLWLWAHGPDRVQEHKQQDKFCLGQQDSEVELEDGPSLASVWQSVKWDDGSQVLYLISASSCLWPSL